MRNTEKARELVPVASPSYAFHLTLQAKHSDFISVISYVSWKIKLILILNEKKDRISTFPLKVDSLFGSILLLYME